MIKMLMFDIKKSEKVFLKNCYVDDFDIKIFENNLDKTTELSIKDCDETSVISVFITSKITKEVLDKFKNLRVITTRSVCFNHIDLEECRRRNIAVINAVSYGQKSVPEFVIGLLFALQRKIFLASNEVKKGINNFENYLGREFKNITLGIIGTGTIGSRVCELGNKLGMKILANDIVINNTIKEFCEYVSMTDLLRKSDIVSLHIPYLKEFKHMFSEKEFEIMKDGSYLINTSQGEFIDFVALYRALLNKKLSGAALDMVIDKERDVFEDINTKADYDELEKIIVCQKLTEADNVIITPGIASDTEETLNAIITSNFNDIKDFYKGRKTNRVV